VDEAPDPRPDAGAEQRVTVAFGPDAAGKRLDKALAERFPGESRNVVQRWLDEGRVLVDGAALPGKTRLAGGETAVVAVPPPRPTHLVPADIPLAVLFEDEHLVVLDKPSGLTVHPGGGRHDDTLANALVHRFRALPELQGSDRPGIVHRLDKDTSGVLVVARSDGVQRALSLAFAERRVQKEYLALVHRVPRKDEGLIEQPIGRCEAQRTKMRVDVEGGRPAVTAWKVERRLPRNALLRCFPKTGRTHQIRVHLMSVQHPVVGDPVYGPRGWPWEALAPRLMLHAHRLAFAHPVTGAALAFEAPVPPDFAAALEALAEIPPEPRGRSRPRP
jgi:23S rRNA pseudouridine1911/1915/1917 synthase